MFGTCEKSDFCTAGEKMKIDRKNGDVGYEKRCCVSIEEKGLFGTCEKSENCTSGK